jgi:type IV pilus assembly protein PilM
MTGYLFDCEAVSNGSGASKDDKSAKAAANQGKQKVLVAGAKKQLLDDLVQAAKIAGFSPENILPSVIAPVNAFERAMPEDFSRDSIALVDLGFRFSSISILQDGELILNRTVGIGGDRLTAGLAEAMNISYAEAEGIKIGMAAEVQSVFESLLTPLGRELRASIDFFEHQQDRTLSQVYLSGGSSRSEFIVESLRRELMVDCRTWNPAAFLKLSLSPEQLAEMEHLAPQLTVAIGAAVTAL